MKFSFLIPGLCLTTANAFVVGPRVQHQKTALFSRQWLDAVDEMCIENAAENCLDEEGTCDVEVKLSLINQLQDQRELMSEKVIALDSLIIRLRSSNAVVTDQDRATIQNLIEAVTVAPGSLDEPATNAAASKKVKRKIEKIQSLVAPPAEPTNPAEPAKTKTEATKQVKRKIENMVQSATLDPTHEPDQTVESKTVKKVDRETMVQSATRDPDKEPTYSDIITTLKSKTVKKVDKDTLVVPATLDPGHEPDQTVTSKTPAKVDYETLVQSATVDPGFIDPR